MTHRLTYNSVNIDGIIIDTAGPITEHIQTAQTNRSGSGKVETISQYGIHKVSFNCFFNWDTYRALLAWFSWARTGQTFSFAVDTDYTSNTTLDDAAASGQKVVPLTSTSGFAIYDTCYIKSADGSNYETLRLAGVSAGVSVTSATDLIYSYSSGDTCRHFEYYPSLVYTKGSFKPTRHGVNVITSNFYYQYYFEFEEAP